MIDSDVSLEWPERSAEEEEDRYESAKRFLKAVDSSSKPSPIERDTKTSFDDSVLRITDELKTTLGKVAQLDDREKKGLESIVRLCARTWLECCSQRYRLLVVLPDGVNDLMSLSGRDVRAVKLLVQPHIKRFGTSQGEDLARGEAVTGWTGLVSAYPVR